MSNAVELLWTGGWDSTFRLLQLVADTDAHIQPRYLVDEERPSTPREIDTMRTIRSMVEDRWPEARERLLSTDYGSYRATTMEPHHRKMWEALKERGRVGLQYPILASYAEQNGIDQLELSIHKEEQEGFLDTFLTKHTETKETEVGRVGQLDDEGGPETLFKVFTFPLLDYTKHDMKQEARQRGWKDIMEKTWFCHNPILGLPCGGCYPCEITVEGGVRSRVGYLGPVLNVVRRVVHLFQRGPDAIRRAVRKRL